MKTNSFIIILFFATLMAQAQKIERIEPPNWWVGMKNNQLELMIYGDDISEYTPSIDNSTISLKNIVRTENKNYLFINLDLSKAAAGKFSINFSKKGKRNNFSYEYELKERKQNSSLREGFNSSDAIYLITPDRFANGDKSNDVVKGLNEQGINRKDDYVFKLKEFIL